MKRGHLKVFLGAAPGVGKTYTMLDQGKRLLAEGKDVVIAVVETHDRAAISSLVSNLEVIPRRVIGYRGVALQEMDLAAVLARGPQIALVDELAHTNASGSEHDKRWQDVQTLLDAGIDVFSTVNIQHIESLNDVVEKITGIIQLETIPDWVLREAQEIEVIDLTPVALRERLAEGYVYPAERIDAALANYFRLGNLTALRELALLWLADEVDSALKVYRSEQGIDIPWEARERVVVALTGGSEGALLLRRGARITARVAGGQLIAVHINNQDGLRSTHPHDLVEQRALAEALGGTFHQLVGNNVPTTLIEFARAMNATQIVIGVSRRSRLQAVLTGPGIGSSIIRQAENIDVHVVNHAAAGGRFALPRVSASLTVRRQVWGFVLALLGGPLLTLLLKSGFNSGNFDVTDGLSSAVLSYQLLITLVAITGGKWPALLTATLSGLTLDYFFIDPIHTVTIAEPLHVLVLGLYVLNGLLTSYVVDQAARQMQKARRSAAESEMLTTVSGSVLRGQSALQALVTRTREAFALTAVRLTSPEGVLCVDGLPDQSAVDIIIVGDHATLELYGQVSDSAGRRLLSVLVAQMSSVLELTDLEHTAQQIGPLSETDRVRSALLSAVSHDLRRPLAAALTAVGSLRATDVVWSEADREELLTTAEESLQTLSSLVTNLLDATRLEAGVLAVSNQVTHVEDVILPSLDELKADPKHITLDLSPDLPHVLADPGLLQRVIVNVVANSLRYAPPGFPVLLTTSAHGNNIEIRVIDRGPGLALERKSTVFIPFQRLGDTDNVTGLGLGLPLSKGFIEGMNGTLTVEDTPGGGLTMVISLPVAPSHIVGTQEI